MDEKGRFFCGYLWEQGKRQINQDGLALWWMAKRNTDIIFAVICDGIGGLSQGENASTYVIRQLVNWFLSAGYQVKSIDKVEKSLRRMLFQLHTELKEYGKLREISLGTTVTLLWIRKNQYLWGNSGDSRLYLIGQGKVKLLTKDHVDEKGRLTRAIGAGEWIQPDFGKGRWKKNKKFLLCTDGFYRGLKEEDIISLSVKRISADQQADRLLKQIFERKKQMNERDNISALYLGRREMIEQ